jgi:hypothetical protein
VSGDVSDRSAEEIRQEQVQRRHESLPRKLLLGKDPGGARV